MMSKIIGQQMLASQYSAMEGYTSIENETEAALLCHYLHGHSDHHYRAR